MSEYLIYTSEGYTTAPDDSAVENCQVLGVIDGHSEEEAIQKLFEKNEWIEKAGFTEENALGRPLLLSSIKEDIEKVIAYLWKDEYNHYKERNYPKDHIFHVLNRLKITYKEYKLHIVRTRTAQHVSR